MCVCVYTSNHNVCPWCWVWTSVYVQFDVRVVWRHVFEYCCNCYIFCRSCYAVSFDIQFYSVHSYCKAHCADCCKQAIHPTIIIIINPHCTPWMKNNVNIHLKLHNSFSFLATAINLFDFLNIYLRILTRNKAYWWNNHFEKMSQHHESFILCWNHRCISSTVYVV